MKSDRRIDEKYRDTGSNRSAEGDHDPEEEVDFSRHGRRRCKREEQRGIHTGGPPCQPWRSPRSSRRQKKNNANPRAIRVNIAAILRTLRTTAPYLPVLGS